MNFLEPNTNAMITAPCDDGAEQPSGSAAPDVPLEVLLDAHHLTRLLSFTTPEIIRERGYRTMRDCAADRAELRRLGFSDRQIRGFPILLIATWFDGTIVTYEIRPDTPRLRDDKPVKYDSVPKSAKRLNVLPRYREWLRDPKRPFLITEGAKKADALATVFRDAAIASISGVTGWKGRNDYGGVTLLTDFDHVAFNDGRFVGILFDIDTLTNKMVRAAQDKLAEILERKGANVYVLDWTKLPEIMREREVKANGN